MQNHKKPSIMQSVLCTIAAIFNLMSLLMIVSTDKDTGPAILLSLATILFGIAAIGNWRLYAKRYVDYKVTQELEEKED